jgi:HEAT repeat protein
MRKPSGIIIAALICFSITIAFAGESLKRAAMNLGSEDADTRREASEQLIDGGRASVPILLSVLTDGIERARKEAALVLGAIGDDRATGALVSSLDDSDSDVRWAAIWALVKIGQPSVTDLINSFENDAPVANAGAEIALARIGNPAVPGLIFASQSKNANVRRRSARLLGRIGDPTGVGALKKLLHDENQAVRAEASTALTKITED